jgi:hypothetical protein
MALFNQEMKKYKSILPIFLAGMLICSCEEKPTPSNHIFLALNFEHRVNNKAFIPNAPYINAANNKYRLHEIKYFVSSLHLYRDGAKISIQQNEGIHYVDFSYNHTMQWQISQHLQEGLYDSIGFVFGLSAMDNQSYRFTNPPEVNMAWPQLLGGGYHYMMLNGWFYQGDSTETPLNIHLGKGQIYLGNNHNVDSLIGFVDNHFYVSLPKSFLIKRDRTATLTIVMNIDKWFEAPFIYNFNDWGSHIMQNQSAMQMLKENGRHVFTIF